jgi:hypothetical protein
MSDLEKARQRAAQQVGQQAQAARATHVPQVATTPADIQSRPVTEADLNNWFLNPTG